jgi:mannose-1-phosphate guanylyltransferase/mannose-6-phosphate isomerase
MSRGNFPKQYLKLTGDRSLLQQTALRVRDMGGVESPIVITHDEQRFLVAEQLRQIGVAPALIALEPVGRNTAPAVAVAALAALLKAADPLLVVLPSDHTLGNHAALAKAVHHAAQIAADEYIVTLGISPDAPHTGYGYIRRGAALDRDGRVCVVDAFIEKPDAAAAARFIEDSRYSWNSGIFVMKASTYLKELERHCPEILLNAQASLRSARQDDDFLRLDGRAFARCPDISIDYAIMEKTNRAAVIAAEELGWIDIGSWPELAELSETDAAGNTLLGDVVVEAATNSYVRAEQRLVAAVGVENLIIVETADAVLVAHRDRAQDVRKVVQRLCASGRDEAVMPRRVVRPWGSYEIIDRGERFRVKRIVVNPGARISLQMHHHRAEHWIVVKGTAHVTNGHAESLVSENQSTYIPIGAMHRLFNPGRIPLELIEVQSGSYLGEDDIVRFEDAYGRTQAPGDTDAT